MGLKRAAGARALALTKARERWKTAPMHVRAMVGDYVGPLFAALDAMAAELDTLAEELNRGAVVDGMTFEGMPKTMPWPEHWKKEGGSNGA